MEMNKREFMRLGAAAGAALALPAWAQGKPLFETLNMFVPAAPGGGWDGTARAIERAAKAAGLVGNMPFENVAGAGGTTGSHRAVRSDPDGHTILLNHLGLATAVTLYRKLPFDPTADLRPVGVLDISGGSCPLPRPEGAQGECYTFTINPLRGYPGAQGWGGLLWQFPEQNWGAEPGRLISPGATEVSFYAGGDKGGEIVTFKVGGTHDPALPNADTLDLPLPVTLSAGPLQHYTISLADQAYSEVIAGFGWVMDVPTDSDVPIIFHVDDLRWR